MLESLGQKKLLATLADLNNKEAEDTLYEQLVAVSHHYEGGLEGYLAKGKEVLQKFQSGATEEIGIRPPMNKLRLDLSPEYEEHEEFGRKRLGEVGFVLVAGGLGERLGSPVIKISLICEIMSKLSFFELYCEYFKRFAAETGKKINLFIMTSDDTHEKTQKFLEEVTYLDFLTIHIEKQDNIPCFEDFDLNIALTEQNTLLRKPHGHGDVHFLFKRSGLAHKWQHEHGLKYIYFFQDTNPFSIPSLPILLSYTIKKDLLFTFLSVGRKQGEAIGALISSKNNITYNAEYNVFQNFIKNAEVKEEFDAFGFSNYSGNTNCFLINLEEYAKALENGFNQGEFINPKIDKETKKITSPFRIESLMQDFVFAISDPTRIGVVELNRSLAFSTCKNNLDSGKALQKKNLASETIIEVENDIYYRFFKTLKYCGINFFAKNQRKISDEESYSKSFQVLLSNIMVKYAPKIMIHPSTAMFISDFKDVFKNVTFDLSDDLAMRIKGPVQFSNCSFTSLSLWIENNKQYSITFENLNMRDHNERVIKYKSLEFTDEKEKDDEEHLAHRMRGYKIDDESKWSKIVIN